AEGADDAARAAFDEQQSWAVGFWFYQYFIASILLFAGAWSRLSPHPWQRWSLWGSALILFVNWFLVQLDVMINEWFGTFYDMIQRALGQPGAVEPTEYYLQIATF